MVTTAQYAVPIFRMGSPSTITVTGDIIGDFNALRNFMTKKKETLMPLKKFSELSKEPIDPQKFVEFLSSIPYQTRFAPSPTGKLHIGGLRTLIINSLFDRDRPFLRIDDTDKKRCTEEYKADIYDTIRTFGISAKRCPPQSDRFDLYLSYVNSLINSGFAYVAFDSQEELDKERKGNPGFQYRKASRPELSFSDANERRTNRVVRLDVEKCLALIKDNECTEFYFRDATKPNYVPDLSVEAIDDFILQKSDGSFSYFLASIVDDFQFDIRLVVRGEEWLSSWNKTLLLQETFIALKTFTAKVHRPIYVHIPLILNPDGSKMSKRNMQVTSSVSDLLAQGYYPDAIFNYAAQLAFPCLAGKFFTRQEFTSIFSSGLELQDLTSKPIRFDLNILNEIQSHHCKKAISQIQFLYEIKDKVGPLSQKIATFNRSEMTSFVLEMNTKIKAKFPSEIIARLESGLSSQSFNLDRIEELDDSQKNILRRFFDFYDSQEDKSSSFVIAKNFITMAGDISLSKLLKLLRLYVVNNQDGMSVTSIIDLLPETEVRRRFLLL